MIMFIEKKKIEFITLFFYDIDVNTSIDGIPFTLKQAGKVDIYYFPDKFLSEKPELKIRLLGDRSYGRFGDNVQFTNYDGFLEKQLIVGAPRRTKDFTEEIDNGKTKLRIDYSIVVVELLKYSRTFQFFGSLKFLLHLFNKKYIFFS